MSKRSALLGVTLLALAANGAAAADNNPWRFGVAKSVAPSQVTPYRQAPAKANPYSGYTYAPLKEDITDANTAPAGVAPGYAPGAPYGGYPPAPLGGAYPPLGYPGLGYPGGGLGGWPYGGGMPWPGMGGFGGPASWFPFW